MREVIATGRTVEEATENGCRELGLGRDEVSVEILEMPVKKLFKTTPARVKVTVDGAEEEAAAPPLPEKPAPAAPPPRPQAAPPAPAVPPRAGRLLPEEPEEVIDLAQNARAAQAAAYLAAILAAMGAGDAKLTVLKQGDATLLRVEGQSVAEKMEVRGEVVQALSYLIDRSVNAGVDKKEADYLRIRLDVAGYRNRRESELIALAQRTGKEVARTGRSRTLAPMNPYERLIVHTAVSKMEGVTSESTGADIERRVVIKSTAPGAVAGDDGRPPQRGRGGRERDRDRGGYGGRDNRGRDSRGPRAGGRGDRDRGPGRGYGGGAQTPEREYADRPRDPNAAPVVPQRRDAIKDGEDMPLYGKIEL